MISLFLETQEFHLEEEDNKEETIFMPLVRSRNLDLLAKVIVDDELVNKPNFNGEAPIHIAARSGDIKVLSYLISHNAFANLKTNQGVTSILYAIKAKSFDSLDLLLSKGAILDIKNKNADTALDLIEVDSMIDFINEKSIK
jgi:ankyrin repeat protein